MIDDWLVISSPDVDLFDPFHKKISHIFHFEKPNVRHINPYLNPNKMYFHKSHALV